MSNKNKGKVIKTIAKRYPLDSGGIIHMASLSKGYANTFRMSVAMKEQVDKNLLQQAFDDVRERFPTIVAGIRKGIFNYYISPLQEDLEIEYDEEILKPFTKKRIKKCAMKVVYKDNIIAVEIFHSLTDGSGGAVFLRTLIARYVELKYGENISYTEEILNHLDEVKEEELIDDYIVNASSTKAKANKDIVYKIPGNEGVEDKFKIIGRKIDTKKLLDNAHLYNASLTTYLTAVMAATIFKVQNKIPEESKKSKINKDIQIMVPINLRKKFISNTLCNFTLFALTKYGEEDRHKTFEEIVQKTASDLKRQFETKNLKNMMVNNTYPQKWIIKIIPLIIKEKIFKIVYKMFGERNSCISVSNFGEISFSENINKYIEDVQFILTPRRNAAYNCSLISYNNYTNISISRKGKGCGLEEMYYEVIL